MAFRFFQRTTVVAALFSTAIAQTSNSIPSDLSAGFSKEVQVSFDAKAVDGFASGTTFEKDAVAKEPTFALGDSNGISPTTLYTLIMVDTTCTNARTLHYARSNFKFAFAGGTNIETDSPALLDYKAPGSLGEQGDGRQYVFLMYTNPQRKEFTQMQLPAEGAAFDVKKFQGDNGLKDPVAGVGMVVKLGGTANCGGEGANQVPSGQPTAAPASSAVPASSGPASSGPSSSAVASSAVASTAVRSSAASATAPPQTSSTEIVSVPSSALSNGNGEQAATPTSAVETSVPEETSPVEQTDETVPTSAAIATLSSVRASATGSPTTSSGPIQQTANAAPDTIAERGAFVAQLLVVAGVLVW